VTDIAALRNIWKSGKHIGSNKPVLRGYVRTVQLGRNWRSLSQDLVFSYVPGWWGGNKVWHGRWRARTGWKALPNILSVDIDQDFDQNGVASATLVIDNVQMVEETGAAGIFHAIQRGYFSPFTGSRATPLGLPATADQNEWFDVLNDKSTQIILLAGYGDEVVPIFEGLVNDCDLSSRPDHITLTCRDPGQVLTDQPVFLNAKARHVPDPITFCDRMEADEVEEVGVAAEANTTAPGHPARFVLDGDENTEWVSRHYNAGNPAELPYVEIDVPHGRYATIKLHPRFAGLAAYVAVLARDENAPGEGGARKVGTGEKFPDNSWVNEGKGHVPGTTIPFVASFGSLAAKNQTLAFPDHGYQLGDASKVRVYFSNLQQLSVAGKPYAAGVIELRALRRTIMDEALEKRWILVDDLSDVVKTVFQWCGLNNWEVESTGVRLRSRATFNRGHTLIDIINAASEQVGYVFYVKPRESFNEESLGAQGDIENGMGIAVWRQSNALRTGNGVRDSIEVVHEDQTLTGIDMKWTDEPLAFNIRVRGRRVKKKRATAVVGNGEAVTGPNRGPGRTLGGDKSKRWMYVYQPPWSRGAFNSPDGGDYRNGNIKKYVVYHNNGLKSLGECKVAALLIAYQEAMEAGQAQLEMPCMPTIFLDHQCALFDTGTGLSTRMYVASRQISWRGGEQAQFKMALGGSLLDLPDITQVRKELIQVLRDIGYDPGLSRWEAEKFSNVYRSN
jgi:hypothetical protein